MKSESIKMILRIVCILCVIFSFSFAVCAQVADDDGYGSYTYDNALETVPSPEGYIFCKEITDDDIGEDIMSEISDIAVLGDTLYVLDKSSGVIGIIGSDYKLKSVIGAEANLKSPEGFFVSGNEIYVADTGNKRIVVFDHSGTVKNIIGAPDSNETLSTVEFEPIKIVADSGGRIYILAKNDTNGIMQLNKDGSFLGYFGSVPVAPDFLELLWRKFSTKEQLSRMLLFVPTEYSSMDIDSSGFLYVTIATNTDSEIASYINSGGSDSTLAPIRKLNPKSIDVLVRKGNIPPAGDYILSGSSEAKASRFIDIAVRDDGYYCVLDSTRSRIFIYDSYGNLLSVFGDYNDTHKGFKSPCAVAYWGKNIVVADSYYGTVKIFEPTDYQEMTEAALQAEKDGDYDLALEKWKNILTLNSNNSLAQIGIGKNAMRRGDYKLAMHWFKLADSKEYYSKAFKLYRQDYGYKFSGIAAGVLILISIGLIIFKRYRGQKRIAGNTRSESRLSQCLNSVKYGFYIMRHPFGGFWDMKAEKKGTVSGAAIILAAVLLLNLISFMTTGYLIAGSSRTTENLFVKSILSVVLPMLLWCAANWSVTTLMSGSGSFENIFMYSSYSLTPMVIGIPLQIILSNVLSLDELGLYSIINILIYIWVAFLLFAGTSVVHQYSAVRTAAAIVIIIVAIGVILFLVLLGASIIEQITTFIKLLAEEIQLRI